MMVVTTKKGGAKKPATKKPAVKKAAAKPATPKLLKTARTVSCYRYPDDTAAKRRGLLRPSGGPKARKRKPRATYVPCKRKLRTPRTKPSSTYNKWDSKTARPGIGAKRPKNRPVQTTRRDARRGQY